MMLNGHKATTWALYLSMRRTEVTKKYVGCMNYVNEGEFEWRVKSLYLNSRW